MFDADLLMAPSVWEIHPDHRACALAAVEVVQQFSDGMHLAQYEVGAPLLPNALVDISAVMARRFRAMRCFRSQIAMQNYDVQVDALNRFRTYTLPKSVVAAEAFRVATAREARADPFGLRAGNVPHPLWDGTRP